MEKIIIIAHGSKNNDFNDLESIVKELANLLGKRIDDVKYAYLKYGKPTVEETIVRCINEGATRLIIHPFFLSSGIHVSTDIPKIIEFIKKLNPELEVLCTMHLGRSKKLIYVIKELIEEKIL